MVTAAFVSAACRQASQPRGGAPNVLLISIDTLRADRLNAYGYRARVTSPNLDALARDAVLFEHHITAAPWTTPSHMSLFTGLLPSAHGVTRSFKELTGALLASAGFERLGDEHRTLPELLSARGYRSVAFTGGATMDPRVGFDRGFVRYQTFMGKLDERNLGRLLNAVGRRQDAPFFIFWHTFEVHAPYLHGDFLESVLPANRAAALRTALDELAESREGRAVARLESAELRDRGAFSADVVSALYDGGVLSADKALGRVVAQLKTSGQYDNTLIVFTSDHGEQLGERDGRFFDIHGNTLHEELIHVPLILKLPASAAAGRRVAAVTRAIDVMPTILDVTGTEVPAEVQGQSLREFWEKQGARSRPAVSESLSRDDEAKSLRTDRLKYVLWMSTEQVRAAGRARLPAVPLQTELYDLVADPGEATNLAQKADARAVAAPLDAALRKLVAARTGKAKAAPMSQESLEELRALGYVQ